MDIGSTSAVADGLPMVRVFVCRYLKMHFCRLRPRASQRRAARGQARIRPHGNDLRPMRSRMASNDGSLLTARRYVVDRDVVDVKLSSDRARVFFFRKKVLGARRFVDRRGAVRDTSQTTRPLFPDAAPLAVGVRRKSRQK